MIEPTVQPTFRNPYAVVTESYDMNGNVKWRKADLFQTYLDADRARTIAEHYAEQFVDRTIVTLTAADIGEVTTTLAQGQLAARDMCTQRETLFLALTALALGIAIGVIFMFITGS